MESNELSPIMEDYLESILRLDMEKKYVRVKDIASKMHVKMPTVTSMLENLKGRDLVDHEKYEHVELTNKGKKIAKSVYNRHVVLKKFLTDILAIDLQTAETDACKMEHSVSPTTMERLIKFMKFIEICPRCGIDWPLKFEQYRKYGYNEDRCLEHMKTFQGNFSSKVEKLEGNKE